MAFFIYSSGGGWGVPISFPIPDTIPKCSVRQKKRVAADRTKSEKTRPKLWAEVAKKKMKRKIEIKSETKAKRECNETRNNNRNKRIRKWENAGEGRAIFGGGVLLGHGREVKWKTRKTTTNKKRNKLEREREKKRGENMHMNLGSIPHKSPGLKNAIEILKIRNDFHVFNEK